MAGGSESAPLGQAGHVITGSGGGGAGDQFVFANVAELDGIVADLEKLRDDIRTDGDKLSQAQSLIEPPGEDIMSRAGLGGMTTRIAVVYYSATGNVHDIAEAIAQGVRDAGAEVRLRQVAELAPDSAIDRNPAWRAHRDATADIPVATLDDLSWADGFAFGSPTRLGNIASQLKQFLDTTGGLWHAGELANTPLTGFTSSGHLPGGQESTLLALYNMAYHWGAIIVPTGYVDYDIMNAAGGNPYGISRTGMEDPVKREDLYSAARFQGARLATVATALAPMRAA